MEMNELQTTLIENALKALKGCIETMEMQEKRMSGEFHIPASTALRIWQDTKGRAERAIEGLGFISRERVG